MQSCLKMPARPYKPKADMHGSATIRAGTDGLDFGPMSARALERLNWSESWWQHHTIDDLPWPYPDIMPTISNKGLGGRLADRDPLDLLPFLLMLLLSCATCLYISCIVTADVKGAQTQKGRKRRINRHKQQHSKQLVISIPSSN